METAESYVGHTQQESRENLWVLWIHESSCTQQQRVSDPLAILNHHWSDQAYSSPSMYQVLKNTNWFFVEFGWLFFFWSQQSRRLCPDWEHKDKEKTRLFHITMSFACKKILWESKHTVHLHDDIEEDRKEKQKAILQPINQQSIRAE